MRRAILVIAFALCLTSNAYTQDTALVQAAYAGTDPQLLTIDVYLLVVGIQVGMLDDIEGGGDATTFLEIPANLTLTASIAPGNSTSAADAIKSFDLSFAPNTTNLIVASGVANPGNFAPNPDGRDISLNVFGLNTARQEANNANEVDFLFFHGATDTPTIDIVIRDGAQIADDLAYGDFSTGYLSLAPGSYTFDVTEASTQTVLASFLAVVAAPITGRAAAVGLLGFSDPSANQNGKSLSMTALFAEGAVDLPQVATPTYIEGDDDTVVDAFALHPSYPNPFNPSSTFSFALPEPTFVRIVVYNALGQQVATLVQQALPAGQYSATFNAEALPAGVYVYTMQAGSYSASRSMLLLK